MASDLPERLYMVSKELGEPLPQFSEDDVLDFMVKEAVMFKGLEMKKKQAEKQERESWKQRPVGSGLHGEKPGIEAGWNRR